MRKNNLKAFFEQKVAEYNRPNFIAADPIAVPHRFAKKQDIEISAFFAAIFAWGNRTTILAKANELMARMDNAPYDFVLHHSAHDLRAIDGFKHRTFNADDLYYFLHFLQRHYKVYASLEDAFVLGMLKEDTDTTNALNGFRRYFFAEEHLKRTRKHISAPALKSSCKRLNMFLRWMVRNDDQGVDFGIWKKISPAQLICPLDVHVARVAKRFGLLHRRATDWQAALELTCQLRLMHSDDPVRYDFALFGLGVIEKY